MDTTRSPGAGIKRLVNAAENKLTAPYVLQVIVAFWSETDLIIVGLLGRTCLIFLITEKNGLQTRTCRLPLVTASGEVMAVMLPREEDREKAENAYEFWSPDKIMPAVNEIMRGRAQELRQDSFWTNFPRGQFAPAYSGGDVEISLIAVLYGSTGETMHTLHNLLTSSPSFPIPHTIQEAEVIQHAVESSAHALTLTREIENITVTRPAPATFSDSQREVLAEITKYLARDLEQIGQKLRDKMKSSIVGRAFYSEPTAEA